MSLLETGLSINARLDSIEAKRRQLLDVVSTMDPAAAMAHPRPGKWSIQELVEHLVLSEVEVFANLAELEQRPPHRRTVKDRVRYVVVMFILRFDIPVSVPSSAMLPKGGVSLSELRARWEANHDHLRAWISASDQSCLDRPRFPHPIAGPMTTVQSLRMLEVHLDRHTRQIQGLAKLMRDASHA